MAELIELIGNTPLLPIRHLTRGLGSSVELHIKAEWFNPGGSVKDRAAKQIVREAIKSGLLAAGGNLLDSSSGNTGIAYAMLGAALDFTVTLCLPKNANPERQKTLRAYGAQVVLTDPHEGSDGAIVEAKRLKAAHPEKFYYADQYSNPANWQAHAQHTGPEIWHQTSGRLTHIVCGLGTTGTCMGIGRYLRHVAPHVKVIAVQPDSPFHGLEGMKHLETAIVPAIYDSAVPHEQRICVTELAQQTARDLARREGLFVGISAGATTATALQIAREESAANRSAVIVAIAPDGGSRYISEHFWD